MTAQEIISRNGRTLGREFTAKEQYEIRQKMADTPNGSEKEVIDAALSYILDFKN